MKCLAVLALVALLAPSVAVCAGDAPMSAPVTNHDCCPKEDGVAAVATAPIANVSDACCRMSSDAAQRGALPTASTTILESVNAAPAPVWAHVLPGSRPTSHVFTSRPLTDHVPRHLLLAVLIV